MTNGTYNDFLNALGQRESGGKYSITNWAGYLGKYQVGEAALVDSGYFKSKGSPFDNKFAGTWTGKNDVTGVKSFLNNPKAQEAAIRDYMQVQWRYLKANGSTQYVGKTVNGITITPSGLLGASHLVGQGAVRTYLKSNGKVIPKDGNNVSLETYLKKFNGYDTPFKSTSPTKKQSTNKTDNTNTKTSPFNPNSKAGQVFASYEDGLWYSNPLRDLQSKQPASQGNGKYANVQKNAMFERLGIEDMHAKLGHLMDGPWAKTNNTNPNIGRNNPTSGNTFPLGMGYTTPPPTMLPPSVAEIRAALAAAGYSPGWINLLLQSGDPLAGYNYAMFDKPGGGISGGIVDPNNPGSFLPGSYVGW